jgi:outer membrane protein TolC
VNLANAFPISRRLAAGLVPALLLSSCAVGPDFHKPDAPTSGYTKSIPSATKATDTQAGNAHHFTPGAPVPERWWTAFGSPALDALID